MSSSRTESGSALRLRFVGLCGVDETFTPPSSENDWPSFVEWGVLFRKEFQGLRTRFPSMEWIESFTRAHPSYHFAAHLCSHNLEQVLLHRDFSFISSLLAMGFKRFQLNATSANGVNMQAINSIPSPELVKTVLLVADTFPQAEFIIQRNEETRMLWEAVERLEQHNIRDNISFLFDASVGTGVEIKHFPQPALKGVKYGYAGGIRPENVQHIILGIHNSNNITTDSVWIDMESGIRDKDTDKFSWEKCRAVCTQVEALCKNGIVEFV